MSFAVVRGEPFASQLYFDGILDEIVQARGGGDVTARGGGDVTARGAGDVTARDTVNLPQILLHCLRKNPLDIFMINGVSGEKITNAQILKLAIPIARAWVSKGARGKNTIIMMRNHEMTAAIYFANLFAGTVPFIIDPASKVFEITVYLKLIEPCMIFCDEEYYNDVNSAVDMVPELETEVRRCDTLELVEELASGHGDDIESFQVPDVDLDSTVMMLPTSGSTGMPKATLMTHRGLVMHLPMNWIHFEQIPKPTELAMLLTTPQWVTFTMTVTSCLVYRVPILMSRRPPDVEWVKHMLVTYRPTWTFFGPAFISTLLPAITKDHLSSLKTLLMLGAPSSIEMKAALRELLPEAATLGDVYGTTEAQGYITKPEPGAPLGSTGRVVNILHYKLIDETGKKVGLCQNGELYIKGESLIKGYYKNQAAYEETFTDGWFRTGDAFYIDEHERLFYLERKKFCFKHLGCHVSPEEVELVIGSVVGVAECVVTATPAGPAAAVVTRAGCTLTREHIHKAVNETLSEHKHLHGGIAFVASIPHTHSGKIKRDECKRLIAELLASGECY